MNWFKRIKQYLTDERASEDYQAKCDEAIAKCRGFLAQTSYIDVKRNK